MSPAPEEQDDFFTTLPIGAGARTLRLQGFELTVTEGPDAGRTFSASGERTVIGQDASADLQLTDKTVSRFHCELTSEGTGAVVVVRDLGSLNGVSVDGVRVLAAHLHAGAVLTLGQTRVAFAPSAEPVQVPFSATDRFGIMVGRSLAMRRAFSLLERAAASNATVLLGGETGTGKEAAAESIHRESARANGPFLVIDCGAIPANLLESELFGHEKGAFTGADRARMGMFEEANGGTLFLDEVGELAPELQPKILRVLEKREVRRLGSARSVPVDVRIVAATNRNLRAEVNAKNFRSDLYYRLAVLEIRLPPLRERLDDIPFLVESILERLDAAGSPEAALVRSEELRANLRRHSWPGNVRELRNYVERCLALAEQAPLEGADAVVEPAPSGGLPMIDTSVSLKSARERWIAVLEKAYLERILAQHDGNVSAAARAAGIDRIHFYRLLRRAGLK